MAAVTLCAVLPALPASAPVSFVDLPRVPTLTVGDRTGDRDNYIDWTGAPWFTRSRPGRWCKHMTRTDAKGRSWSCVAGEFVMDDFGFLVEVPA